MRAGWLSLLFFLPLLVACKVLPEENISPPILQGKSTVLEPVPNDAASRAPKAVVRPKARPTLAVPVAGHDIADEAPALAPVTTKPEVAKSKEQNTCEKRGGNWGNAGKSNLKTCIKRTKDAGKQCRKQGDCDSVCLARSGTCAPVDPLFGCNEVLQKDGSRVTLCID